jgi:phosphohistidine phosphatase SixA
MKTKIILLWMGLLLFTAHIKAQWVVTDPTNLVQGIVNSANQIVQTSSTAKNMISNFQETVKIYNQGKEYYDKLKNVHDLVKDARKVQQTVLLIGEISKIFKR